MIQDVANLDSHCRKHKPEVAVLCLPEEGASVVAPALVKLGVQGFWNFSHYDLAATQNTGIVVENVHLGDSLMSLGYRVRHNTDNLED